MSKASHVPSLGVPNCARGVERFMFYLLIYRQPQSRQGFGSVFFAFLGTSDFYDIVNENHESYLKRETREKRTERLHMKILPSLKQTAERNAKAEGRTLSNYIEKLIAEDEKRKAGK